MLITASAACRIIKQKAGEPVETFVSTGSPAAFGAADEARTRYLHLGKVALYQMSYGRIFGAFVPAPSRAILVNIGAPAKACEARFCGEEEEFQSLLRRSYL